MNDCGRCGAAKTGDLLPRYSVRTTLKPVDGETAVVQFRARTSFEYNEVPMRFAPSQVVRLSYIHIYAVLRIDPNLILFLNSAEQQDFQQKHPDVKAA